MSDPLPLFPLPNVVLFPNVFLPLHVFETRYREMVADALRGDRLIGMVLLRPGWEHQYEGRPAVFPVGCVGVITHVEHMDDGRYNIVLRGVERFRILAEDHSRPYRSATIEVLPEPPLGTEDRARLARYRNRLEQLLAPAVEKAGADPRMTAGMSDEDLVNALAQHLDLEPLERQALLEQNCLRSRAGSLVELLEMKILVACNPGVSHIAH
jgi:Lon protease-like protein